MCLNTIYKSLLLVTFSIIVAVAHNTTSNYDIPESWGSTEVQVSRFRYTWTIKNFSFCEQEHDEMLKSPYFTDGIHDQYKWNLVLYPKGYYYSEYLSLFLQLDSNNIKRVAYKIAILDENHEEIIVLDAVGRFDQNMKGTAKFSKIDYILDPENGILVNDQLTIFCEINATIGSESSSGKFKQSTPHGHLLKDLEFLLENQSFSDVTLSARGIEFKAHKAILAIRSEDFKDMFEHDENMTRVEIIDVDPVVVKEMLRYIYTDEVSNLQYLALDLLDVAVKYDLDGLKSICENAMSANLTIGNSVDYFVIGDTYGAEELKIQAQHFILTHIADVVHTQGFKSLIHSQARLLEDVFMN